MHDAARRRASRERRPRARRARSRNVLRVTGSTYYFAQEQLRALVQIRLSADEQRVIHLRVAECILGSGAIDTPARMAAGFHLIHAGDEHRGADLLREAALDFVNRYDDMIAAAPALEEALRVYRARKKKPLELLELLFPLCFAGYYVDRRLADRHARPTVLLAESLLGLGLARRLRPFVGDRLSLWFGLAWGAIGFVVAPGRGGVSAFKALLSTLTTCIVFLCAKSTICLEAEEADWLAERLEPLTALGPRHATTVCHRYAIGLTHVTRGHAARVVRDFEGVLEQLGAPRRSWISPWRPTCRFAVVRSMHSERCRASSIRPRRSPPQRSWKTSGIASIAWPPIRSAPTITPVAAIWRTPPSTGASWRRTP